MDIAIIGGGITGLTTALVLNKLGIQTTVYEKANELKVVGAGIWLQPNAIQVLDWLGLKEKIISAGSEIDKMEITNTEFIPFKKLSAETVQDEFGNKTIAIHRARLQEILFNELKTSIEIKFGKEYISQETINDKIKLNFKDESVLTDIVLGADGIHSIVRKNIFNNTETRNSGQICFRGIANFELPKELKNKGKEMWGNNLRFGFSEISQNNEVYWFAVNGDTNRKVQKENLVDVFKKFASPITDLIANTENIHEDGLLDLKRLDSWYKGNTCLLGDAAHATTPNMGQGACQGIEDAYHFGHLFAKEKTPADAFERFETKRRKKVDYIVNNSWLFGKMAHHKIGRNVLKLVMKITPEKVMNDQMKKIYSLEE